MKELIIDPRFSYYYASFYLYGLNQVYGNCKFKKKCFIDLPFEELAHSNDRLLCYMVKDNSGRARKIVIDYRDQTSIIDSFYDWADVYAKINVNETETIVPDKSKLRLIAPGFGIRYYNLSQTLWNALSNLLVIKKGHFGINVNAKDFLRDYLLTWYRRRPYKEYHLNSIKERDNYVFFVSTLWRHQNCIEHTNPLRALFMRTCKKLGIDFEGGFYISQSGNSSATDGYKDLLLAQRVELKDYIVKTRQSMFVYNVPSCLNCHGWKLGEFLAMGKSIISAPLYNELPGDGKQIMLSVDSEEELEDAIVLLTKDTEKRKIFEANALTYYKKYVSPEAVIQYLDKQ
jgi:hypothetical protein